MDSISQLLEHNVSTILNLSVVENEAEDLAEDLEYLIELPMENFIDFFNQGNNIPIGVMRNAVLVNRTDILKFLLDNTDLDPNNKGILLELNEDKPLSLMILLSDSRFLPLANNGKLLSDLRLNGANKSLEVLIEFLDLNGIKFMNIESEQDIIDLSNRFLGNAVDGYLYPVKFVYDPLIMISHGFFPTSVDIKDNYFTNYVNGMTIPEIKFWMDNNTSFGGLHQLNTEPRWIYNTIETHKINGVRSASSLPLLMFAPELVYKGSIRPITDMSIFRSTSSLTISRKHLNSASINFNGRDFNFIPVTRYAAGMNRGLYNETNRMNYCGTFYYYEPESTTLLLYQTSSTYPNKYKCLKALDTNNEYPDLKHRLERNLKFMMYVDGKIPQDLILTPEDVIKIKLTRRYSVTTDEELIDWLQTETLGMQSFEPRYAAHRLELYALEDDLDQPICKLAAKYNKDIIILEKMIGSHKIVTEILDTRSREESFKHLVYVI